MTVKGVDIERQFAILQCDTCGRVASTDITSLFRPD